MKRLISSVAALASLVAFTCLLSACGQKGPLYLPDDSKPADEQAKSSQAKSHEHSTSNSNSSTY